MKNTLVLVHGYLGGSTQWEDQVDFFRTRFNVVAINLPGFGRRNNLKAPDSIEGFAVNVLDELSVLDIGQFYLLGHSMGGMIAQEMARLIPNRIKKLILYATGSLGSLPGRFETIQESKSKIVKNGVANTGRNITATWFVNKEKATNYSVCTNLVDLVSRQAALAGLTAMEAWSGQENLSKIKSPTLVLWGDKDLTYRWQQTQKMWQEIPESSLAVVPNCAHMLHLEKKDLFNHIVLDFVLTT